MGELRREVAFEVHYRSAQEIHSAYAGNISGGGLFIRTKEPPPLNKTLRLRFTLPGIPRQFECQGLVVWTNPTPTQSSYPTGMGIKFLDLASEAETLIKAFVLTSPGPSASPQPAAEDAQQQHGRAAAPTE